MNIRKVIIEPADSYQELEPLFREAGLELTEADAKECLEGFRALAPDGTLVGGTTLAMRQGEFVLSNMAVKENLRGQGLGFRLLAAAMERFLELGAKTVWLTAKVPGFYRNYGFQTIKAEESKGLFRCADCPQLGKSCQPEFMKMDLSGERLLFVDSCVRGAHSRTRRLCSEWMKRFLQEHPGIVTEVVMPEAGLIEPLDGETAARRTDLVKENQWEDPVFDLAKQWKRADWILVGAPYWDCAFPAVLKIYLENIVVDQLTFHETEKGYEGLCPCRELTYITTAGGPIGKWNLGFDYICALGNMLGIPHFTEYCAEGMDIWGADPEKIIEETVKRIRRGEPDKVIG